MATETTFHAEFTPDVASAFGHLCPLGALDAVRYDHAAATLTIAVHRDGRDLAGNLSHVERSIVVSTIRHEDLSDRITLAVRELAGHLNDPKNLVGALPAEGAANVTGGS